MEKVSELKYPEQLFVRKTMILVLVTNKCATLARKNS